MGFSRHSAANDGERFGTIRQGLNGTAGVFLLASGVEFREGAYQNSFSPFQVHQLATGGGLPSAVSGAATCSSLGRRGKLVRPDFEFATDHQMKTNNAWAVQWAKAIWFQLWQPDQRSFGLC